MFAQTSTTRLTLVALMALSGCGPREIHAGGGRAGEAGTAGASGGTAGIGVGEGAGASSASGTLGTAGASGAVDASEVGVGGLASGGHGGASAVSEPVPDLVGVWTMIGFEDPLTVELSQSNGVLAGRCFDTTVLDCDFFSGPLIGTLVGRHAHFDCLLEQGAAIAGDMVASTQGNRMTGMFSFGFASSWSGSYIGGPTTWLRAYPSPSASLSMQVSFGAVDQGVQQVLERLLRYDLSLSPGTTVQQAFVRDRIYQLGASPSNGGSILGDLGAFSATEMAWHEDAQVLEVGPVAETDAALPIGLQLRFSGTNLVEVDATMPSGTEYAFQVAEHVAR